MSAKMFRLAAAWGALAAGTLAGSASAQYCPTCPQPIANPCPPPVCNVCEQLQPVVQPCYQTVPVTEYRPQKVTVQKPINETEWVDREVTEYRPVCDTRTAEVPTVSWQTVTECKTVQRDMGCWTTQYQCNPKVSPCQYDGRPGLAGWWNRTNYSMRSAFTPQVTTRRVYVPNVVTQQVPVTRQVPQYGTRQVTYNVTRMEPYTTTRKVAVNKVRWVAEEITQMQAVTVMKTIPTGTTIAWVSPGSMGSSATANALSPTPDPNRSRSASRDYDDRDGFKRSTESTPFGSETAPRSSLKETFPSDSKEVPVRAKPLSNPVIRPSDDGRYPEANVPTPADPVTDSRESAPTIVRTSRWVARKPNPSNESKPATTTPPARATGVSVAGNP